MADKIDKYAAEQRASASAEPLTFMQTFGLGDYAQWRLIIGVALIIMLAATLRLGGLFHDLPYSFYGDELHFIKRSMAMGTGDLNPHWFNKPAMLMYILLFCYGLMFIFGYLAGNFPSPEAFGAYFLEDLGPFILVSRLLVLAFALLGVWVIFEIARRVHGGILAGWLTALAAACLPPLVFSSQTLKADVAAGLFVLISVGFYLRTYHVGSLKWPILAAVFAGFAMGTKYYGIILLPIYGLAELARVWTHQEKFGRVVLRGTLVLCVFFGTFFLVSPYSFFDPTLQNFITYKIKSFLDPNYVHYAPDAAKSFEYGIQSVPAATLDVIQTLLEWASIGAPMLMLCSLGFVQMLRAPAYRWHALIILGPCLVFLLLCVTIWAYHASPRHFNAIYGLLLLGLYPGAVTAATHLKRWLPKLAAIKPRHLALAIVAILLLPSLAQTLSVNAKMMRLDSRALATEWIKTNLPGGARILMDDYGPEILPNPEAIQRRLAILESLPVRDSFTVHQIKRLDLLERFPPQHAFNFDELGHPWWSPTELTNAEMRAAREHRTMGNPLSEYEPLTAQRYAEAGYRYIITNSEARSHYLSEEAAANHPSYVRFYQSLQELEPLMIFDPADWQGKGPTVEIYRLP